MDRSLQEQWVALLSLASPGSFLEGCLCGQDAVRAMVVRKGVWEEEEIWLGKGSMRLMWWIRPSGAPRGLCSDPWSTAGDRADLLSEACQVDRLCLYTPGGTTDIFRVEPGIVPTKVEENGTKATENFWKCGRWLWKMANGCAGSVCWYVLWDTLCVLVKVLPPANVSVELMKSQEYELRWKKHSLRYGFIKQKYQVQFWIHNQYEKVRDRKCRSRGFLFALWLGMPVPLTSFMCTPFLSPDCADNKYYQWWTSLHLHWSDAVTICKIQGKNACNGELSGLSGILEWMEWGVHLGNWERYFSSRLFFVRLCVRFSD